MEMIMKANQVELKDHEVTCKVEPYLKHKIKLSEFNNYYNNIPDIFPPSEVWKE